MQKIVNLISLNWESFPDIILSRPNTRDEFEGIRAHFIAIINSCTYLSAFIDIDRRNNQYRIIHTMKDHGPFHPMIQSDIA